MKPKCPCKCCVSASHLTCTKPKIEMLCKLLINIVRMWAFISTNGQIQCWNLELSLNCKASWCSKSTAATGRGLQAQGQFRGGPEHSTLYQYPTWKGQFQGINKAAQNIVGIFLSAPDSFQFSETFLTYPGLFQQKYYINYLYSSVIKTKISLLLVTTVPFFFTVFSPFLFENWVYLYSFFDKILNRKQMFFVICLQ